MRHIYWLFVVFFVSNAGFGQDMRAIEYSTFLRGPVPMLEGDPSLYNSIFLSSQLVYNLNKRFSVGLLLQGGVEDRGGNEENEFYSELSVFQPALLFKINHLEIGHRIKFYSMLTAGTTRLKYSISCYCGPSYMEEIDNNQNGILDFIHTPYEESVDLNKRFGYDQSYFTIGGGIGVDIALFKALSFTAQIAHYDLLQGLDEKAVVMNFGKTIEMESGQIIFLEPLKAKRYYPLFFTYGVTFKLIKKKR